MTDNVKKEITQLRISGMGYGRISHQLGIPLSTVKSYCIRNNVPSKARGQKLTALLCSDFCQAPIFYFAKRHFEKTLDNIVSGIATLLYVDWLPQCNGFAVSATI